MTCLSSGDTKVTQHTSINQKANEIEKRQDTDLVRYKANTFNSQAQMSDGFRWIIKQNYTSIRKCNREIFEVSNGMNSNKNT